MKPESPFRPLRLAFVCFSSARGGLELMLVRLADSLRQAGHHVIVISPDNSAIQESCHHVGIRHYALTPRTRYLDLAASGILRKYFTRHSTQIAIVGASKDISTVVLVKRHVKGLRVAFFQQMQSGIMKKDLFHRWAYGKLDRWITLTRAMKESAQSTTTVPAEMIEVIPLGVNLKRFAASRYTRLTSRSRFRLPARPPIVGLVGRFDPQKGQETLLQAAAVILKKLPKTCFAIVGEETRGESGYLNRLKRIVEELGIGRSVQFLPFTERVPELLAAFDVTAMPSYSETYGYLAIESMAMGVPVVGTNAGGLPEIIEDNSTGILVPPKDPEALARGVLKLLLDRRLSRAMSRHARRRATQYFDYNDSVRRFQEALTAALPERDRREHCSAAKMRPTMNHQPRQFAKVP